MNRKTWVLAGAAVLFAVAATFGVGVMFSAKQATSAAQDPPPNTVKVEKGKLSAMVSLYGTLTYRARSDGSPYSVINQTSGTVTWLPEVGQVVEQGQVIYRVDGNPVVLLYGATPAYRTLSAGMTGADVTELNANLVALGYATAAEIPAGTDTFTSATATALNKLQASLGMSQTGTLTRGALAATVSGAGNINASQQTALNFQLSGVPITKINVMVGDKVKAGDVLALEDDTDLQFAVRTAQASLASAKANLAKLTQPPLAADVAAAQASIASAQSAYQAAVTKNAHAGDQIASAKAALANASAAVQQAQAAYDRIGGSSNPSIGMTSQSLALQTATNNYQAALAAYNLALININDSAVKAAAQQVASAQDTLAKLTQPASAQDLAVAQASVDSAQVAVDQAQHKLGQAKIVAPFDGTVAAVNYVTGQLSSATSSTPVIVLANMDNLTLGQVVFEPVAVRVTNVSAILGGTLQAGQPVLQGTSTTRVVTIALDAAQQSEVQVGDHVVITLPDKSTTPGVVTSVGVVATTSSSSNAAGGNGSSSTPTVNVEVQPADPAATGSSDQVPVQVGITTQVVESALSVPVTALVGKSGGGFAVEVVRADGRRELVAVKVGLFDTAGGRVEVEGDLHEGDQVVVPSL